MTLFKSCYEIVRLTKLQIHVAQFSIVKEAESKFKSLTQFMSLRRHIRISLLRKWAIYSVQTPILVLKSKVE